MASAQQDSSVGRRATHPVRGEGVAGEVMNFSELAASTLRSGSAPAAAGGLWRATATEDGRSDNAAPTRTRSMPRLQRSTFNVQRSTSNGGNGPAGPPATEAGTEPMFSAAAAGPAPPPSASFLALPDNAVSFNPDTQGAVGPNHLMVTLGSQVRIQDRAGGVVSTVSLDAFWGALGSSNVFDPRVLYDPIHQRWLTVAIANPATNDSSLLLAVSQTSDPTGNWFRHQIRVDLTDGVYAASPNLGWCRDWVVVSAAMHDKTGLYFYSADVFAFNRTNLYAGGPAQFTRKGYGDLLDAENIPAPAACYDASFATNFLVANWDGSHAGGPGRLRLFTVSGPVAAPVFNEFEAQGGLFVSAGAAWGNPSWLSTSPGNTNFAPQAGSPIKIFLGDARIQNVVYRNGLLWCAHHVFLPTNAATRAAVQWWSFSPGGTVLQHGRVDDPTGVKFFAYPSIAVNRYDDVLLGYSRFAANQFASANYAFHGYEAVPGSLSADTVLKAGEAKFAAMDGEDVLWGDWSGAVVDPANDTDLWTIQEYAAAPVDGIDRWGTWWGRVSPPVSLSVRAVGSPTSVLAGSNVTYSIQVTNRGTHIATGVRLIDTLPPGAAFVSAVASQGVCGHTNGVVTCNFGDVAGDIETNVVVWATIVARLNQGGTATNSVSVLSFGPDALPADNSTRVLTQVNTASDLAVTMTVPPDVVVLSNNVTFTVTVTNLGPGAAASTWLTNVLPAGLAFVSATPTVGSCSHANGRVSCSLATLGMNAGARVTVVARAIASGFATNRANAVSSAIDPAPANSSASAFVKASARPTIQTLFSPQSIQEDGVLGPLTFSIGDVETPPESLVLGRASSNTNLVPVTNIIFGGSGATPFFRVIPLPNASGSVNITRTVTDADGLSATNTFQLNIAAVPDQPTISDITNQTVAEDTVIGPLDLVIGDAESSAATLNLSGASSNQGLVPNANITFGGSVSNRTVTVRPLTNMSGSATITVTVSDGGLTASDSFVVTVNEVNDLPTINDVGNRAILEDSTGTTIGLSLGDVEAPAALILSGTSSNLTLVPNGNITFSQTTNTSRTVTIVPAPNQFGTSLITLTVTDSNNARTSDTFVLTVNGVNDPPTLAALSPLTINEDSGTTNVALSGISFGASNEGQTNRITATSNRPGLIPDPTVVYSSPDATGTLSFAPVANSNGLATITVTVNDGGTSNNVITRTFNVTVNAVNDPPSISAITNVVVNEDTTTGAIPFTIGDAESAATALSVAARALDPDLIANLVVNGAGGNRNISISPAPNRSGQTTITVFVGDGTNTNTMSFVFTVREMNDLPSISIGTNQFTINEDQATNISLTIGDVETAAAALTLSVPVNPSLTPNISFGGSGSNRTVNILPATNLSGTVTIDVFVSDGAGGSNSTSFILTVVSVNDPPTLDAPGNLSIPEDSPVRTVLLSGISSGAPNEAQPLTVTAVSGNPALLANPAVIYFSANSTGRLELLPRPNASGTAPITVSVSDSASTNSWVFDLTVTPVNDPPSISSIANRQVDEDSTASVPLVISDLETPAEQLEVLASSSNPELLDETGIRITGSGAERTLFLSPLPDQSDGLTTITVTVTDGSNEVAVASFDLTVRAVNDAPTISGLADLTINQGSGPTNIFFTVSDPESLPSSLVATAASLNQTLVPNGNLAVSGNGSSRTLTMTPVASQSGTAVIQVILRDGPAQGAAVVTNSFVLTVVSMEVSLRIERFGSVAVVSWPTNSPGWTLQSTANVALPGSWINVSTSPAVVNDRYAVTNVLGGSALFFRLRHP